MIDANPTPADLGRLAAAFDRDHAPRHTYRIVRVADPRSRGACSWYEIEGIAADGDRWHVATCDDRREARELVRRIEADDARRQAEALTLAPAEPCPPEISDDDPDALILAPCPADVATLDLRSAAASRRLEAARAAAAAVRGYRDVPATRAAIAAELRAARTEYDAAFSAYEFFTP